MSGLTIAGSGLTLVDPSGGGTPVSSLIRGSFLSTTTQSITNTANPQAITFDTPVNTQGISLVASTKMTIATTGFYLVTFDVQAHITSGSNKNLWVWLRNTNCTRQILLPAHLRWIRWHQFGRYITRKRICRIST